MPGETEGSVERLVGRFPAGAPGDGPSITDRRGSWLDLYGHRNPHRGRRSGCCRSATLAAANGRLKWSRFVEIGMATVRNAFVFAVMIGATCFAVVLVASAATT